MAKGSVARLDAGDRFHPDPARSYTINGRNYWDAEVYARELDAVFCRSWNFAGHVELVREPGQYTTVEIGDQSVVVVRGKDGELRAFYNVCKHRAHQLLKGSGRTKVITCPYHAWSYHIDGRLRTARGSEKVAGFDKGEFCLTAVRVETFCGFVYVNLDPDALPLAGQVEGLEAEIRGFAPRIDELTFSHRMTYDLAANWKNIIENFLECYHCAPAHPDFATNLVDMSTYRVVTHQIHHSQTVRARPPKDAAYAYDPESSAHGGELGVWFLWPNLGIEVYPGGYVNTFHVIPVGPERSIEHVDFYFFDKQPTEDQWAVIKYRDEAVQVEDVAIVESVQRGLHSRGYGQGRFMVDEARGELSEHAVHHFQALVRKHLDGEG